MSAELAPFSRAAALARVALALPTPTALRIAYCQSPAMAAAIARELASGRYDLIHCDRFRLCGVLPAGPRPPVVWDLPDALDLYYQRALRFAQSPLGRLVPRLEGPRIARRQAALMPRMAATLVCSPVDAAHLARQAPGAHLEVVENTVDTDEFHPPGQERRGDHLVFAGTLSYLPNVDGLGYFMRDIWPRLRAGRPHLRLRLVGTRPGKVARAFARQPGVELVGHVPNMAAEMAEGILVCPIRVASGTRIKLLEAMAAEMPIVSTSLGIEGLSVQNERELLVADDAARFVAAVERLLSDPALRARLAEAGRRYVERHHSLAAVGRKLEAVYERACASITLSSAK
ncbi:glycosyltransferase [bacterium]|nr:glycosyltransferase [bacterium]